MFAQNWWYSFIVRKQRLMLFTIDDEIKLHEALRHFVLLTKQYPLNFFRFCQVTTRSLMDLIGIFRPQKGKVGAKGQHLSQFFYFHIKISKVLDEFVLVQKYYSIGTQVFFYI